MRGLGDSENGIIIMAWRRDVIITCDGDVVIDLGDGTMQAMYVSFCCIGK